MTRSFLSYMIERYDGNWHSDKRAAKERDAGRDCLQRTGRADWWEWVDGSSLFFWRWPPYCRTLALLGHRPCYLDIDSALAFSESTPQMAPPQYRGLQLQDPRPVAAYIKDLTKQLDYHKITDKAQNLLNRAIDNNWTETLTEEYEKLDTLITEAMLRAEKNVSKKVSKTYQWSPSLQASISALSYWKLRLSQLHGKAISTHTLNKLFKKTSLNPVLQRQLPIEEVVKQVQWRKDKVWSVSSVKATHETVIPEYSSKLMKVKTDSGTENTKQVVAEISCVNEPYLIGGPGLINIDNHGCTLIFL